MRLSDVYGGNALNAQSDEIGPDGATWTIEGMKVKEFENGKEKIVLTFRECNKALICNQTNALQIGEMYGDDPEDWIGNRITIYKGRTKFNGRMVPCLLVKEPPATISRPARGRPTSATASAPVPARRKPVPVTQEEADGFADEDAETDDVPF